MGKIQLTNFADIKSFEASLEQIMLFTGPQQETRLALAKLILLFRNWEFEGKLSDYKSLLTRFSIPSLINSETRIDYESNMRKIVFNGEYFEVTSNISATDERIRTEEIVKKQVIDILQEALDEGSRSNKPEYLFAKLSEIKVNINSMVVIPAQRAMVAVFADVFNQLKGSNLPFQATLYDFANRFETAKETIKKTVLEPWELEYRWNKTEDLLYSKNNSIIKLSEASSAIQAVLPLKLVLDYYATLNAKKQQTAIKDLLHFSYLIEEPELHLHPKSYSYIVNQIINSCSLEMNSLITTSNNEDMVGLIKQKVPNMQRFDFDEGAINLV